MTLKSSVDFFATNTAENAQGTAFRSRSSCCSGQKFPSINGGNLNIGNDEVVGEATNRCIQVAGQMRAQGMYVYSIGLDNGNALGPALDFLQQVANDPASSTFDSTKPVGAALMREWNRSQPALSTDRFRHHSPAHKVIGV